MHIFHSSFFLKLSGAGKYMSIFFCILQGKFDHLLKWPFSHPLTFSLLDQSKSDDPAQDIHTRFVPNAIDKNRVFLDKPATYRNPSLGEYGYYIQ